MSLSVFWATSVDGDVVVLTGQEAHHAAVVRRLGIGERVRVTDGQGSYAEGPTAAVERRSVTVSVERRESVPRPTPLVTVVQAIPKSGRAELAVEGLTEVGVDRIVPWASSRSQVRATGERADRLVAKWQGWAYEASKQSRRTWFCVVAPVASTADVAALLARTACGLVLHEEADSPLAVDADAADVVLVVGPEGGITPDELAQLAPAPASGAQLALTGRPDPTSAPLDGPSPVRVVRLGHTVLRTSTAGAVAAGVVLSATRWR